MAEFTDQLGQPSGSHPVINTAKPSTNPLGGVADFVNTASKVFAIDADRKKDEAKAAAKARADLALDKLALVSFEAQTTPQGKRVLQAKRGLDAGAISPIRYEATLQAEVRSLLNEYPDQAFEMFEQFEKLGIESAMFREFRHQQAQQDAAEASMIEARTTARTTAINAGLPVEQMTDDEVYEAGRQIMEFDRNWTVMTREAQEDRARRTDRRAERGEQRTEESHAENMYLKRKNRRTENAVGNLAQRVGLNVPMAMRDLAVLSNKAAASQHPDDIAALDAAVSQLSNDLVAMRATGLQQLSSPDLDINSSAANDWNTLMNGYDQMLIDLTTGDLAARSLMANQLSDLSTSTQLEAWEVEPYFMGMTAIFGKGGSATLLANAMVNSPALGEKVTLGFEKLLDHLEVHAENPNINTVPAGQQSDVIQQYKEGADVMRQVLQGGFDETAANAYSTLNRVLLSTIKDNETLTPADATNVIQQSLSTADLMVIERMRKETPKEAITYEGDLFRGVDIALKSLLSDADVKGATEGLPDRSVLLGTGAGGAGGLANIPPSSNIKWNEETQSFVTFGIRTPSMVNKAEDMNQALNYIIDYSKRYRGVDEDTIIDIYVRQELNLPSKAEGDVKTGRIDDVKP